MPDFASCLEWAMSISTLRGAIAALVIGAIAFSSAARPAKADTTSTILLTAAAVAALATGINVAEKSAKAHTVVGYLQNGSIVYADGHVVAPNGQSWYPGNYGQSIACNGQYCAIVGGNVGYGGYPGYPGYGPYQHGYAPGYSSYPSGTYGPANAAVSTTAIHRDPPQLRPHANPVRSQAQASPRP